MFWFAAQRGEPYLLWSEWPKIEAAGTRPSERFTRGRLAPFLLLWMAPNQPAPTRPTALSWTGHGKNPVAFHRSAWTADASFVAIKGGSPSTSHAHMDVGAFVMDADGLRWADDLGRQDYHSLEEKGVGQLWVKAQDAGRWKVFRLRAASHNVLMVDGQNQRVEGMAKIVTAKTGRTVVDTSPVYEGQLAQARRGVALHPDRSVRVQDEITALPRTTTVRWAMVTHAEVEIEGPGRATLSQAGKTLGFRVLSPAGAVVQVYPTDPPPNAFDARNEGTRMIGFEMRVPAGHSERLVVQLVPQSVTGKTDVITPLDEW
jgi:hypothetical protein